MNMQRIQPPLLDFVPQPQPQWEEEDNPEQEAKNRLIEISSQEVDVDYLEKPNRGKKQVIKPKCPKQIVINYSNPRPSEKPRVSVADNYTQSHRVTRRGSPRPINEQSSFKLIDNSIKNQSSFIIFQNGYLNTFNNCQNSSGETFTRILRTKPPKNMLSLMRHRNKDNIHQHPRVKRQQYSSPITYIRPQYKRNLSATSRITKSYDRKEVQSRTSTRGVEAKQQETNKLEASSTNQHFRNKKISDYMAFKTNNMSKAASRYCPS